MIDADVVLGANVRIFNPDQVNIFGCEIGDNAFVGPFVEITRGVVIGPDCVVESHAFICDGATLARGVFVGHGVMFTNDLYPRGARQVERLKTFVDEHASLGSNCTIIGGVRIGRNAVVGAGAVVTKDVPDFSIVVGNPARVIRQFKNEAECLAFAEQRQATAKPQGA
jgi:UDP-2-acetamido-3-amino-2,3-dideoxy-glucuronate N-acetyltransferase